MKKASLTLKKPYSNYEEFEREVEKIENSTEKGDAFEFFVYFYLTQHSDYYNIKEIYMEDKIPKDLREILKLERKDNGVDGVIVRNDGKIVAYQAKFRSQRGIPTAQELSTFWAESEYADFRLIIANCASLPKVANKKKNQLSILIDSFLPLDSIFFTNFSNYMIGTEPTPVIKYSPRPYQRQMLEDIKSGFHANDRGKAIAACGIGKTLVALWLQEEMGSSSVLYIVPSLALIKQTLDSWVTQRNVPFSFLCVCSDSTVVGERDEDDLYVSLSDVDFPVTTNPNEISTFLSLKQDRKKIVFVTYNSLDAISNALNVASDFTFELGIFDESHRTAGTKDSLMFIYGMSDEFIRIDKRLFMTATERLVSPRIKSAIDESSNIVFSMDDKSKYGPTFTSLNFGAAIEKGIICDYKIVVCTVTESDIAEILSSRKIIATEIGESVADTSSEILMKQVLVPKAMRELGIKKMISYHSFVKNAKDFIAGTSSVLPIKTIADSILPSVQNTSIFAEHINGSMSAGLRREILMDFESSEIGIVSNAKCLTEGVDVPAIDAVYFVDPKNSMIDIVQAVGRALRISELKSSNCSYIIIPIIVPNGASIFSHINPSNFDTLHNVIQAMRSQDEALADIIDEINFSAATGTLTSRNSGLSSKVLLLPYSKLDINDFEGSLQLRIAEVNKNPSPSATPGIWSEATKNDRKSEVKRVFVSIGDYSLESYRDSLVMPTLLKFPSPDAKMDGDKLKINHNNVSHAVRMGMIQKNEKSYSITPIGLALLADTTNYLALAKEQLLKSYCFNKESNKILFPYRAILKIFLEIDYVTRFEFLYAIYSLRDTSDEAIRQAIDRIYYLRETYPNIDILSDPNKEKVLELLNTKYDVQFGYKDIWTSRTTTYNQYNYFKKQLWAFDNIFDTLDVGKDDKDKIRIIPGTQSSIAELLKLTSEIEVPALTMDIAKLEQLYNSRLCSVAL